MCVGPCGMFVRVCVCRACHCSVSCVQKMPAATVAELFFCALWAMHVSLVIQRRSLSVVLNTEVLDLEHLE